MARRTILTPLLVFLLAWLPAQAATLSPAGDPGRGTGRLPTLGGYRLQTSGHGLALSVALPRRSFPRGALTTVDVVLRNVSGRTVYLAETCTHPNPDIRVVDHAGAVVYPPAIAAPIPSANSCKPHSTQFRSLHTGHSLGWRSFIVLRGSRIGISIAFGVPKHAGALTTMRQVPRRAQVVPVTLTSPDPPILTVTDKPTVTGTVSSSGTRAGALLFADWYRCTAGGEAEARYWLPADASTLQPPCFHPVEWHILAGYINHSLGCMDYYSVIPGGNGPPLVTVPIPDGNTSACPASRQL